MSVMDGAGGAVLTIAGMLLAGFRPFLGPLRLDSLWLVLVIPLVIGIAVTYKTIKLADLANLHREAAYLAIQIIVFMALAAITLWMLTELL